MLEIERKFLVVEELENVVLRQPQHFSSQEIQQLYLSKQPEIRLRSVIEGLNRQYYFSTKSSGQLTHAGTLSRVEVESEIQFDPPVWAALVRSGKFPVLTKQRFVGRTAEGFELVLDRLPNNRNLCLAEVEFPNIEAANRWVPYEWMGREVTEDPAYRAVNLCQPVTLNPSLTEAPTTQKLSTCCGKPPAFVKVKASAPHPVYFDCGKDVQLYRCRHCNAAFLLTAAEYQALVRPITNNSQETVKYEE